METMVKERPIIMGAQSVQSILAGRKTQTRRVVKWPREYRALHYDFSEAWVDPGLGGGPYLKVPCWHPEEDDTRIYRVYCPYGCPGDVLWVRETWRVDDHDFGTNAGYDAPTAYLIEYKTYIPPDEPYAWVDYAWVNPPMDELGKWAGRFGTAETTGGCDPRWRSPIHMPRWACRLKLEITGVRLERLQDITPADAYAEGIRREWFDEGAALLEYAARWDQINRKRGFPWDANSWVWVMAQRVRLLSAVAEQVRGRIHAEHRAVEPRKIQHG